MGWYTLAEPIERVGLAFVGFKPFPNNADELHYGATRIFHGCRKSRARACAYIL